METIQGFIMSLFLDQKYLRLISGKLLRFSQKSDSLWNFRCPFCGDSKKNQFKARGYVYRRKNDLFYTCHNCNIPSKSFSGLLEHVDKSQYRAYLFEKFSEKNPAKTTPVPEILHSSRPVFETDLLRKISTNLMDLPPNHFAHEFVKKRCIPEEKRKIFFFTPNFIEFSSSFKDTSSTKKLKKEPRLIIPFYDEKGILQGVQGRALGDNPVRYITLKVSEDSKKVFGLDRVDMKKKVYVVEGPLDSLFLDNSVASMDSKLYRITSILGDCKAVFVYDNEPSSKYICQGLKKTIELGYDVVIWPRHIKFKDINDMVLGGYSSSVIMNIIDKNTYNGLDAMLEYSKWSKI